MAAFAKSWRRSSEQTTAGLAHSIQLKNLLIVPSLRRTRVAVVSPHYRVNGAGVRPAVHQRSHPALTSSWVAFRFQED